MSASDEPEIIGYELLSLASEAKNDPEYMELINVLENKSGIPVLHENDPLSSYDSVWGKLTIHTLSSGKLVLFDGVQVVVPCNARKELLSSLHEYHQGFGAMFRLARNHLFCPTMQV